MCDTTPRRSTTVPHTPDPTKGHEQLDTTAIYLHADLSIKERALARTRPPTTKPGRYKPTDTLIAFLEAL